MAAVCSAHSASSRPEGIAGVSAVAGGRVDEGRAAGSVDLRTSLGLPLLARMNGKEYTMPCPTCQGGDRVELAPGYFRCTTIQVVQRPTGAHPSGALGPVMESWHVECGTTYQEASPTMPGSSPCPEHGLFAVGVCLNCHERTICGECAGRWCPQCRAEKAIRDEKEAALAEAAEVERRAAELEHFRRQAELDAVPIPMGEGEAFRFLFVTDGTPREKRSAAEVLAGMSTSGFVRLAVAELESAGVEPNFDYYRDHLLRRPTRVPLWRLTRSVHEGLSLSLSGGWVTPHRDSDEYGRGGGCRPYEGPTSEVFAAELRDAAGRYRLTHGDRIRAFRDWK